MLSAAEDDSDTERRPAFAENIDVTKIPFSTKVL
jgi:hypothetical protein